MLSWLKDEREIRRLQKEERVTLAKMKKAVEKAKAEGQPKEEIRKIEEDYRWDARTNSDIVDAIRSKQLVNKAIRYLLPIPPKTEEGGAWCLNGGAWVLEKEAFISLRKSIRDEEKFRREIVIGWAAAVTGILGAATGLAAILLQIGGGSTPIP